MVYILRILILMVGKLLIKLGQLFLGAVKVENKILEMCKLAIYLNYWEINKGGMILLLSAKFCKAGMLWWGSFSCKAKEKNEAIQEKLFGIQCRANNIMMGEL